MNLLQLAPIWLLAILCAALIAAAIEDAVRLKISNVLVIAVLAMAVVAAAMAGWSFALWENVLVFVLLLGGGTFLYGSGKMGGGDVKLFAAVGLWTDLERALMLVAAVFIAGGIMALAVLLPRLFRRRASGSALRDASKGIPYAVAIAAGALLVIAYQREVAASRHPNPLEFQPVPSVATQFDGNVQGRAPVAIRANAPSAAQSHRRETA